MMVRFKQRYLTTNLYIFYEVANLFDLTRMNLYDLSKPQWWVGLGAGLGVGHSYKFMRIWQFVKNTYDFEKKTY